MGSRFDLDKAITAWRRPYEHDRAFQRDDLDELEDGLRDRIDALTASGMSEEQAFMEALRRMGDYGMLEGEYRKVFWEKQWRRHTILNEIGWRLTMLKSYLVVMLRNLRRQKGYAFINILGLTLGLTTCLIIGLYVRHELSYDRYHATADRVYRLYQEFESGGGIAMMPPSLAKYLEDQFPEIERATVLDRPYRRLVTQNNERFYLEDVIVADDNFLHVFPFRLLHGHPDRVLSEPNQMVLTQSTARQLFGTEDAVGETLIIENEHTYTVAGVMEDVPTNSHFRFNALFSLDKAMRQERLSSEVAWNTSGPFLYLLLHEGADAAALEDKIRALEAKGREQQSTFVGKEPQARLQPLTDVHLYLDLESDIAPQSDIRYLYLFSGIGLIILLIACINYMNLATARSMDRAREVGVRKVVGAQRGQLAGQFLGESVLTAFLTLPLSIVLAALVLPAINAVTGQELTLRPLLSWPVVLSLLGLVLGIGVLAGSYPALFLSRFRPSAVLMGRSRSMGRGGLWLRQSLVVFQFAATIVLLVGTLVVQFQLDYIRNKPLGFDQEYVVTLNMPHDQYGAFKETLLDQSSVRSVSAGLPPGMGRKNMMMVMKDEKTQEGTVTIAINVDYGYLETMGMKLLAGRDFDPARGTDAEQSILVTSSAASQYGLSGSPVGQTVSVGGSDRTIIGIIDEVINESLLNDNWPIVVQLQPGHHGTTLVRLRPESIREGIADIESVWKQFVPDRPFEFAFLDERIAAQYEAEQRLGHLSLLFTGLAILVACLGLFGLAAFTAEQRTKEIGIRKVMGASVTSIVGLLSRRFLVLVCIALLVATPLAYLAMSKWLENFAHRIELGPGVFILAGALTVAIAVVTVSYQSIKAALSDPVKSLRYE